MHETLKFNICTSKRFFLDSIVLKVLINDKFMLQQNNYDWWSKRPI